MGFKGEVCTLPWPEYDESKTIADTVNMAVQVGGKLKSSIEVATLASDEEIVAIALADAKVAPLTEGMELIKSIVVKGRIVNLIFKPRG